MKTKKMNNALKLTELFTNVKFIYVAILSLVIPLLALIFFIQLKPGLAIKAFLILISAHLISLLISKFFFYENNFKHVAIANLIALFIYALSVVIGAFNIGIVTYLIAVFGSLALVIWFIIGWTFFEHKNKAVLFAIIQFLIYSYLSSFCFKIDVKLMLLSFSIASFIMFVLVYLYIKSIVRPLNKVFGIKGEVLIKELLRHWFYGDTKLEDILDDMGDIVEVETKGLNFDANNYIISAPPFHFGPLGSVGSSNAPSIAIKNGIIFFHSLTTHDFDVTKSDYVYDTIKTLKNAKKEAIEPKLNYFKINKGNATAYVFEIGEYAMIILSRYPEVSEDVEYTAGKYLEEKLKRKYKDVILIDAHNSSASFITFFDITKKEFREYEELIDVLLRQKKKEPKPFEVSIKHIPLRSKSLCNGGINIIAFKQNNSRRIGIILLDSNGIKKEAKESIEAIAKHYFDEVIICTTDSHEKNIVKGVINDFQCDKRICNSIESALKELTYKKPKLYFLKSKEKVKILGYGASNEVVGLSNALTYFVDLALPLFLIVLIITIYYLLKSFL